MSAPSDKTPQRGRKRLALKVVAGPAAGRTIRIGDEPITFGRAQSGESSLNDPELSPEHLKVDTFEDGRLVVEDLDSINGSFVNGAPVAGPTIVDEGDVVWIGWTTMLVQESDEPLPEVPPVEPPTPSAEAGLLSRIAIMADRHPKRMLLGLLVFLALAFVFGGPVTKKLRDKGGFEDPSSESRVALDELGDAGGVYPGAATVILFNAGRDVRDPAVRAEVESLARNIQQKEKGVRAVGTFYNTGEGFFVSRDRRATLLNVLYDSELDQLEREDVGERLREEFENAPKVVFGAQTAVTHGLRERVESDLRKAELLGLPLLFLVSLFVFRGVIAALLPIFVGIVTIFGTLFALRILNSFMTINVFALNIVVGLGLGLAIDYSLFIVSRYREELAKVGEGRPPTEVYGAMPRDEDHFAGTEAEALRRTMMTAGRTILFSAATVAVAMASLTIFPQPFLYSMGIGGAACAVVAVSAALVALPAVLGLLGTRVNSLAPDRWQRAAERTARQEREGPWYRLSQGVMRRPGRVALLSATFMIAVGVAFLGIKFTGVNARVLPDDLRPRKVADEIEQRFAADPSSLIQIEIEAPPDAGTSVAAFARRLEQLPDVAGTLPPRRLNDDVWELDVQPWGNGLDDRTIQLVRDIRAGPNPFPIKTAGETSAFVDERDSLKSHLPWALLILVVSTVVILFLMTGSIVLPIKSVIMNLLTLSFTLGLLVLIFQDGRFEGLLGYDSVGAIDIAQPILICAVAFGLSTDYSVFLLGRINEARIAGAVNKEAVAIGLERTGRIVTQAAILFCLAIGAFATSSVIFIKEIGVGTAAAVIIDSTIIRALLVPALMAMLGDRNWWAPRPLRRLHNKIGLSEA